jgi:sugar lactone lactonase YvrE
MSPRTSQIGHSRTVVLGALLATTAFIVPWGCGPGSDNTQTPRVISTVMGTGYAGNNGENLDALDTQLYLPQDLAFSPDGTLFVVDWNNHRIRKMSDGKVSTVAGTGELTGEDQESGVSVNVKLNHPTNICFDNQGRMVIAAWHNSTLKRFDLETGWIENFAGVGGRTFDGDGGQVSQAHLNLPSSVVVTSIDEIVFSDQGNQRIRIIHTNGIVETLAGDGTPGYSGDGGPSVNARINAPFGQAAQPGGRLAIDTLDRIYIADTSNHRIRMIDNDGTINTIVGTGVAGYSGDGGSALEAQLDTPSDVEITADGTIYIADTMNNVIRRVTPDGVITTVAGTGESGFEGDGGPAEQAKLNRPYGITMAPNGDLYIADTHNNRIRKVSRDAPTDTTDHGSGFVKVDQIPCTDEVGTICTYAGIGQRGFNGDGLDRLETALYWPFDIEFTPSGRIYVIDWNNHKIRRINPDQTFEVVLGGDIGDGPPDFSDLVAPGAPGKEVNLNHATDMLEMPNGDLLVTVWHNHKYRMIDPVTGLVTVTAGREPGYAGDGGPFKDSRIDLPMHSILDDRGNLITLVQKNWRIRIVRDFVNLRGDGIIDTIVGTGKYGFNGDGLSPRETQVAFPKGPNPEPNGGLVLDSRGFLYFADSDNHRIRRVEFFDDDYQTGVVTTICGTGEQGYGGDGGPAIEAKIDFPQDMELGQDGRLYFCDTNNNRVRVIDLETGLIATVAGNGEKGDSGDGGLAVDASFNRPFGIAFDFEGDMYVSDTFSGRIRKVKMNEAGGRTEENR